MIPRADDLDAALADADLVILLQAHGTRAGQLGGAGPPAARHPRPSSGGPHVEAL